MKLASVLVVAVALGAAVAFAAATPSTPVRTLGNPAPFLEGVIRLLAANRYAQAWNTLDRPDQQLVPRSVYVACELRSPIPGHLVSLQIRRVRRDPIGVAVTFTLTIAGKAVPGGVRVTLTAHALRTKHGWAWMLPPARRALYRSGCDLNPGPPA